MAPFALFLMLIIVGMIGCRTSASEPNLPADSAQVSGIVEDSVGLLIPNAVVEIVDPDHGLPLLDTSDNNGKFSFDEHIARPNRAIINVRHPDFQLFSQNLSQAIAAATNPTALRVRLESGEGSCVRIPVEVVYQPPGRNGYAPVIGAKIQ